jgi:hypothetical protein
VNKYKYGARKNSKASGINSSSGTKLFIWAGIFKKMFPSMHII